MSMVLNRKSKKTLSLPDLIEQSRTSANLWIPRSSRGMTIIRFDFRFLLFDMWLIFIKIHENNYNG